MTKPSLVTAAELISDNDSSSQERTEKLVSKGRRFHAPVPTSVRKSSDSQQVGATGTAAQVLTRHRKRTIALEEEKYPFPLDPGLIEDINMVQSNRKMPQKSLKRTLAHAYSRQIRLVRDSSEDTYLPSDEVARLETTRGGIKQSEQARY